MKEMLKKLKNGLEINDLSLLNVQKKIKLKKSSFKSPKIKSGVLINDVNFEEGYFKTRFDEYFSLVFLGSFNVMASDSITIDMKQKEHSKIFANITSGLQFIDINVSQDYHEHIDFLKSKYGENDYVNHVIDEKVHQFNVLSKMTVQLSYAFVFADSLEELKKKREDFIKLFYVESSLVSDPYESAQIIFKINNKNLPLDLLKKEDLMVNNQYDKNKYINTVSVYQKPFFNVKDIPYIRNKFGYETCLHISEFNKTSVDYQWLKKVSSLEDVIVIRSHITQNVSKSIDYLNNQDHENFDEMEKGRKASDRQRALLDQQDSKDVMKNLSDGEVIVETSIRIYCWGNSVEELDKKHSEINQILILDGQVAHLDFFMNERDWLAPFQSLKYQKNYGFFTPILKEIPSDTLGATLPYDYQMLFDEQGVLLGNSFTGQPIVFNQFKIDEKRNSYHVSLIGNMGKGKSTLMKILEEHTIIRGDYLFGFDFEKERKTMVEKYYGLYPDGSKSALNPLEIYVSDIDEDLSSNYVSHLSRLNGFFKYLYEDLSYSDLLVAQMVVQQTYYNKGITPYTDFRNKTSEEYPIFDDCFEVYKSLRDNSDLMLGKLQEQKERKSSEHFDVVNKMEWLKNNASQIDEKEYELLKVHKNILKEELGALEMFIDNKENLKNQKGFEKLDLLFKSLSTGGVYSMLFNRHTTFNPSADNKTIIVDMSKLWNGELNVLQAVYYTWNNFFWSKIVHLKEQHDIPYLEKKHATLSLDEAKVLLDPKNTYALEQLSQYSSRGRKYFFGMIFGLQALRDIIPEAKDSAFLDTIKRIFSLVQYTFMFQQSGSNLPLLDTVFPHLTERQLQSIPYLKKGQTLLMVNDESYFINIFASDRQKALFTGGL